MIGGRGRLGSGGAQVDGVDGVDKVDRVDLVEQAFLGSVGKADRCTGYCLTDH